MTKFVLYITKVALKGFLLLKPGLKYSLLMLSVEQNIENNYIYNNYIIDWYFSQLSG